ncbi:MAG: 50S ribosomal protein L6 [Alphaproteobacteria bacterium]|nr:50S ribosomal protein L6 [Alphaproteobacteria bacterium]MCY4229535.1 50S ribosomal protein L6 [Alphaproteobacteria bacterium]MCY4319224.1 50S ribosomal protein L6 [Alphaproteobacteria bacterium]
MSRIGKNPVVIPDGAEVRYEDAVLSAKGSLGELSFPVSEDLVEIELADARITVRPRGESKRARAMWGTTRALAQNIVTGVSQGFTRKLEINGVGYRAEVKNRVLVLSLGYSHPVEYPIPEGIEITCERPTMIAVSGADRQRVGQVASEIRAWRKPEPYKGKGVRYEGEYVFRKEGKKK